jgi:hypothetical protein
MAQMRCVHAKQECTRHHFKYHGTTKKSSNKVYLSQHSHLLPMEMRHNSSNNNNNNNTNSSSSNTTNSNNKDNNNQTVQHHQSDSQKRRANHDQAPDQQRQSTSNRNKMLDKSHDYQINLTIHQSNTLIISTIPVRRTSSDLE